MTARRISESYAEAMHGWAAWQREYRFGVLLIYPPDPVRSVFNRLRSEHDPRSQSACDAHISLSVAAPFPPSHEQWAKLESSVAARPPVLITYGPLKTYKGHPGVVLHIEPQSELDALRAVVESAEPFSAAPPRRRPFSAHMTIAEFITLERSAELMDQLTALNLRGEFLCSELVYAVPDESFHFAERRRLPLRG